MRPDYTVRSLQNIFDLAVQLYGDVSEIGKIVAQTGSVNDPALNSVLTVEDTDNALALSFFNTKIVATSDQFAGNAGGIGIMIIETTFIID